MRIDAAVLNGDVHCEFEDMSPQSKSDDMQINRYFNYSHEGDVMEQVEKIVEVACPVNTVYNQWTQFEEFPKFMAGVKEVHQLDDTRLYWHAEIWGKDKEWESQITEQTPDKRISWQSTSGTKNAGTVRFEQVSPSTTRVRLTMSYEPDDTLENLADALGVLDRQVQSSVDDFKDFIEQRNQATGAWRGEVHKGQAV
jgi:uncharacterized membrane protein